MIWALIVVIVVVEGVLVFSFGGQDDEMGVVGFIVMGLRSGGLGWKGNNAVDWIFEILLAWSHKGFMLCPSKRGTRGCGRYVPHGLMDGGWASSLAKVWQKIKTWTYDLGSCSSI